MLVPYYLMASYAYYKLDDTFMSDEAFDTICTNLLKHWDEVEHRHKHLIQKDALQAGTGYALPFDTFPKIIKESAKTLLASHSSSIF